MLKNPQVGKQQVATKPKKTMATLRLQKDLSSYNQQKIEFVKLQFPLEGSLQTINVSIKPQIDSLYSNTQVKFQLVFPDTFPMDPPKIKCLNRIFHPNISYQGNVCLPLVREDYEPTTTLESIVCGLIFVMTFPNAEDALNPDIGDLMAKSSQTFKKILDHTVRGGQFKNQAYDKIFLLKEQEYDETDMS